MPIWGPSFYARLGRCRTLGSLPRAPSAMSHQHRERKHPIRAEATPTMFKDCTVRTATVAELANRGFGAKKLSVPAEHKPASCPPT